MDGRRERRKWKKMKRWEMRGMRDKEKIRVRRTDKEMIGAETIKCPNFP